MSVEKDGWHVRRLINQLDALLLRSQAEGREDLVHQIREAHRLRMELDLAGVDLREVEYVVHKLEERSSAGTYGLQGLIPVCLVIHAGLQQLRIAEDRVERRADVVAHDAEEQAPRPLRRACTVKRLLQLRRVLHRQLAFYEGPAQLCDLVLDDEDVEEAVAHKAAERIERP